MNISTWTKSSYGPYNIWFILYGPYVSYKLYELYISYIRKACLIGYKSWIVGVTLGQFFNGIISARGFPKLGTAIGERFFASCLSVCAKSRLSIPIASSEKPLAEIIPLKTDFTTCDYLLPL